ncbi:MAG: hypothetical protein GQ527_12660 [Bacteroidales bacterium]|nr:hypothetical protein [Bacteroidales bacterium]
MKKPYDIKAEIDSKKINNWKTAVIKLLVITVVFLGSIVLTTLSAKAQETWSLVQCIDYAVQNNIALNVADNNTGKQQINLRESKARILPTLNMGSGVNMSFGRNIDGNTNEITYDQTLSNNYWISSSIDLFQGLVKYNAIGFNKYLLSATKEEAFYVKNKLVFDVLTAYYIVLYSKGLRNVAQSQVTLSEMQFERMQKLVDIGRESPITVQELKSQWASDKLSLTQSQNLYNKTLGELKQLLRLDAEQSFTVDTMNLNSFVEKPIQNIDSLFNVAVNILPEIKQQEFLYKASIKDLAIAKGGIAPRIYMSAGFYTGYFDGDPLAYKDQISDNQNQAINMGITIPIFNNTMVNSSIKRKKIVVKDRELAIQNQRDALYTEIWRAIDDLHSAENEYQSALELHEFSELSLENATKKMEKGLASPTDYEVAKQRFTSAKASLLKARLLYFMRRQMLMFYQSGNWNHILG